MKPRKQRWAVLKYRQKIRNVLLTYYLTPILLILLASGGFFYYSTKRALDEEMGQRLTSIAMAASSQVKPFHIAILELKDPSNLTYQTLLKRFNSIRESNKVSKVYLFDINNESLLDTDPKLSVGATYERNRFNKLELTQANSGIPTSSVLFQGTDGAYYKSAFAPVIHDGTAIAFVGVDGSATFFKNLHLLGRRLAYFSLACIGIIVLVSVIISRKIVTPIGALVTGAQRIGEGHLEEQIEIQSENEIGFLGFVLDEMRKSIVSRDRELNVMLRGIAHEVRNPLGGMELFTGLLEEEIRDPRQLESVRRIQHEIKTLKNLVEEFLDFAKGPMLQPSAVAIEPFFDDIRVAFQKELESKSIDLKVSVNGIREVEFDPDQMRRVFLNLIQNSIQAIPSQGGKIEIDTHAPNGCLEISISDTGQGIAQENLEKLFDPFFTTKEKGTGLGLSFVRKIVSAHAGEVRVESNLGKGTKVTVVLPR